LTLLLNLKKIIIFLRFVSKTPAESCDARQHNMIQKMLVRGTYSLALGQGGELGDVT
jgi:hypothetical protein